MPYLIDGHNLIPKMGLNLQSVDDEEKLLARLQEFCRLANRQVEVYFDGAPPGQAGTRKLGRVTAHFIRLGTTADDAMRARLRKMGAAAKNWTVVTSDHAIQAEARAMHAQVLTAEEFTRLVAGTSRRAAKSQEKPEQINQTQVEEWLELFQRRKRA